MVTFDFEGSAPRQATGGPNVTSIVSTVTDAVPGPSVSFTISYSASWPFDSTNFNLLSFRDVPGVGFRVGASGTRTTVTTTTSGSASTTFQNTVTITIAPSAATLSFALNTTTLGRTAFDGAVTPTIVVDGVTFNGTVTPGGGAVRFTFSSPATTLNISQFSAGFLCFCAGTRIATPDGDTLVENLRPGDEVSLASGGTTRVRWIGRQTVDVATANPAQANPIRITRGALGRGLPERDLRVSKDYAIAIDGLLINAGALVNGTTIYQEQNIRGDFTYYHIETDAHELILAEGVAAETFVDYTTRDAFENAHEGPDRVIPEMPLPRISSARLVPEHIKDLTCLVMATD